MSYLSDLVRAATGRSIGANIGGAIGGAIGGPGGAAIGSKIGASTTEFLDTDRGQQQGQSVAVDVNPGQPKEQASSGTIEQKFNIPPNRTSGGIVPAVYRVPSVPQRMGTTPANLPAIVGAGRGMVQGGRGIMNMLGLAGGAITVAPIILDPITGQEKKLRVTRRLKRQVKEAVQMFGIEFVAEQMGTDVEVIVYILTKRMRNDGPFVTKAAVRKTRATVRKMKSLCDMYDDLRPAARRRAPARKTMSTRITNVK
jgi:hypothetical protein